jgi:hypothetical protein
MRGNVVAIDKRRNCSAEVQRNIVTEKKRQDGPTDRPLSLHVLKISAMLMIASATSNIRLF